MPSEKESIIAKIDFISLDYTTKVAKIRDNLLIVMSRILKDDDDYKLKQISRPKTTDDNEINRRTTN